MADFIVHGIPGSPYVRTPLLVLEEKGLDWELAALPFGGHRTSEHRARHPFLKIPAFEHRDFQLYETQAIIRYLDRIVPTPPLTPADPRRAARMDQLLNIADCYMAQRVSGALAFARLVAPRFGMPVDETKIAAAMPEAAEAIGEVARLSAGKPFLAGDTLSLADLHLIPQLSFLPHFDEGRLLLSPYPELAAWIDRMAARPSMAATSWEALCERSGMPLPALPEKVAA
ncbi:MAG: glutathione S-transferase family protein [Sphingomonas sp.]